MKAFFTVANLQTGNTSDILVESEETLPVGDLKSLLELPEESSLRWKVRNFELSPSTNVFSQVFDGDVLTCWSSDGEVGDSEILNLGVRLEIAGGPNVGESWSLGFGAYSIGRDDGNDIRLSGDLEVSKRHAVIRVSPEGVDIEDQNSTNGTLLDGVEVIKARVRVNSSIELGSTKLVWSPLTDIAAETDLSDRRKVSFNRPPRIFVEPEASSVHFPTKVSENQKAPFPLLAMAAPVIFGVAMVLIQHSVTYLLFTAMSPLMAAANYFSSNRRGKGTYRTLKEKYDAEAEQSRVLVSKAAEAEESRLNWSSPGPNDLLEAIAIPQPRLWERRREDPDFLKLRLGMTTREPSVVVVNAPDDSDEQVLRQINVPATLDLKEIGVLGIVGPERLTLALTRWLVLETAAFHAPDDVALTLFTEEDAERDWSWFRWLPHARPDSYAGVARIANTDRTRAELSKELDVLVRNRSSMNGTSGAQDTDTSTSHLVIIDNTRRIEELPALAGVLRSGFQVNVLTICRAESEQTLPEECRAVVSLSDSSEPQLQLRVDRSSKVITSVPEQVSAQWCETLARFLAPIRRSRTQDTGAVLPNSVRLLEILRLENLSGREIRKRWSQPGRSTLAVIGASLEGLMAVDISKDGPHALIAGTTGSGKSELLQTLIASLAVVNRPDTLNFVLVDYKGGSAFKDCARLPHTVGLVTDLDGHLTERALESLGAELTRRERVLQKTHTKDIEDYWGVKGSTDLPQLARLVIVIDEFASLVEELPMFVDGLVDIARRGRSLGIHLVLATQRPSGVVSPAIKTNTNLRVAMRVTDSADSIDVIDSPLAARIAKIYPGRGYVRAGHERLSEFQAARVGGRTSTSGRQPVGVIKITWESLGNKKPAEVSETMTTGATDLSELVRAVTECFVEESIQPPQSPWLAPLPSKLTLRSDWFKFLKTGELKVAFGLEDRPSEQKQIPAFFNIEHGGHMLISGDSGSGRSTFLRTLAASIALQCSAADVHFYGIDCGNGALFPLIDFPNCGAVVSRTEVDRVDRLITRLLREVARRQQLLSAGGFSSIAEQRTESTIDNRVPYIVVLIDRWEGFAAEFEALDSGRLVTSIFHLMKEGLSVGLRLVIAGDRTTLSAKFAALVESTIVLRLNDRGSYSMAGLNPRKLPENISPGRGFRAGTGSEIQISLLDLDPGGQAQIAALKNMAEAANIRDRDLDRFLFPVPLAPLPQVVPLGPIFQLPPERSDGPRILTGVGGDRAEPQWIDLAEHGPCFVIGGPPRSGRSNALVVAVRSLLEQNLRVLAIIARNSPLSYLNDQKRLKVLDGRTLSSRDFESLVGASEGRKIVVIDDAELLIDAPMSDAMSSFIRSSRDNGNVAILAGTTSELASGFRGFAPEARKSKSGLVLCPTAQTDGELVGARLSRTLLFPGPPGRGVLCTSSGIDVVQIPLDDTIP